MGDDWSRFRNRQEKFERQEDAYNGAGLMDRAALVLSEGDEVKKAAWCCDRDENSC
jgi:hypothetical protein